MNRLAGLYSAAALLTSAGCASPAPPAGAASVALPAPSGDATDASPPAATSSVGTTNGAAAIEPESPPGPPDPSAFSVVTRSRPPSLRVDAALDEWGSLAPPSAIATAANPANAASRLAIVVDEKQVVIAGELAEIAKGGVSIGIASLGVPELAPVGELYTRSGQPLPFDCEFHQDPGPEGSFSQGKPLSPAQVAACKRLIEQHERFVAGYPARFERRIVIDAGGAAMLGAEGARVPIAGVEHAFVPHQGGARFEAVLPLEVLPRLIEAPLETLRVAVAPRATPAASGPPTWVDLRLAAPVHFQPMGEIRARVFAERLPTAFPPGLSYHPTQPLVVETVTHPDAGGPVKLVAREEKLYRKIGAHGDVEIALVDAYGQWLAISRGGRLLHFLSLFGDVPVEYAQPFTIRKLVERGGDLHIIAYRPAHLTQQYGIATPEWVVIAVAPDGTIRKPIEGNDKTVRSELVDPAVVVPYFGRDTVEFSSPDLDRFGVRGVTNHIDGEYLDETLRFEVSWKWDGDRGLYVGAERRTKAR